MKAAFCVLGLLGIVSAAAAVLSDLAAAVLACANAVRTFGTAALFGGESRFASGYGVDELDDEFYYGDDEFVDESMRRTVEESVDED